MIRLLLRYFLTILIPIPGPSLQIVGGLLGLMLVMGSTRAEEKRPPFIRTENGPSTSPQSGDLVPPSIPPAEWTVRSLPLLTIWGAYMFDVERVISYDVLLVGMVTQYRDSRLFMVLRLPETETYKCFDLAGSLKYRLEPKVYGKGDELRRFVYASVALGYKYVHITALSDNYGLGVHTTMGVVTYYRFGREWLYPSGVVIGAGGLFTRAFLSNYALVFPNGYTTDVRYLFERASIWNSKLLFEISIGWKYPHSLAHAFRKRSPAASSEELNR